MTALLVAAVVFVAGFTARWCGFAAWGFAAAALSFVIQCGEFTALRLQLGALAAMVAAVGCAWACGSAATARFRAQTVGQERSEIGV